MNRKLAELEEEEEPATEDEQQEEEQAKAHDSVRNKKQRTSQDKPVSTQTNSSSNEFIFSSQIPLKLDAQFKHLVGLPTKPINYKSNEKSQAAASRLDSKELTEAVSAVTRFVLGNQLAGKPLTGKDIIEKILAVKLQGTSQDRDFNKFLLGFIRVEVSRRLKDVFGFELFAGESDMKTGDKWYIRNSLKNDHLNMVLMENSSDLEGEVEGDSQTPVLKEDADRIRGALMIVLSILMLHKAHMKEKELKDEMMKFNFEDETSAQLHKKGSSKESAGGTLNELIKLGFIKKEKKDGTYLFQIGEKTLNEIGLRGILQFMIQVTRVDLDADEENLYLRTDPV